MTSNVGAKNITETKKRLGFAPEVEKGEADMNEIREAVLKELRHTFRPEFLNRIDDIIVFHRLSRENIREIAGNMLKETGGRMQKIGISLKCEESAVDLMAEKGYDPIYGARPLRRTIQSGIEDVVAEKLLEGSVKEGDRLVVTAVDGKIEVNKESHATV